MNIADLVVMILLGMALCSAGYINYKKKKSGKGGCGCGCSGCAAKGSCESAKR